MIITLGFAFASVTKLGLRYTFSLFIKRDGAGAGGCGGEDGGSGSMLEFIGRLQQPKQCA
jgi:hypothetical protein